MKIKLLLFLILSGLFYSCNQEHEMGPVNELVGSYEFKMEHVGNHYELDFVNTLQFRSDGTVYGEGISKISGTDQQVGYRYYFYGSYKVEDGNVHISETESFRLDDEDSFFAAKSDLVPKDGNQVWNQLLIKDHARQLQSVCSTSANCLKIIFYKTI